MITVTNVGFVFSLLKVDPTKALLLMSLNPLWAALLGYAFLGDKLEGRTVVAQLIALVSIALVFVPNVLAFFDGASEPATAPGDDAPEEEMTSELFDLVPLVTGIAIAAFMTYSRYCSQRGISDASLEAAPPIAALLTTVLSVFVARQQGVESIVDGLSWSFWLALGVDGVCLAGYNACLVVAPRYLPSAEVALVLLGETVFGPVWVFFGFGVVPSLWTLIGGVVLLATLVIHEVRTVPNARHPHPKLTTCPRTYAHLLSDARFALASGRRDANS